MRSVLHPLFTMCRAFLVLALIVLATGPALAQPGFTFGIGEPGPTGPIFSGPQQQPFLCETEESGLGTPIVDNHDGIGMPVYDGEGDLLGFSQFCSAPMQVRYYYRSTDGSFKPLADRSLRPADLSQTSTSEGLTVDYVVRVEMGTINRFIYGIAMLAPYDGTPNNPHLPRPWNGKLLYYFGGGVGIGNRQGRFDLDDLLLHEALSQGWAVAHSTGNVTSHQYNLVLAEETMMMVKDHFIARYGRPRYTVGLGGSGGAIQQYIIAQNHPGLLDGLVPISAYPDMITQSIYVGDCELMEYLLDQNDDPRWRTMVEREVFEGLAGNDEMGATACVEAWRGLTQLAINPYFQKPDLLERLQQLFPADLLAGIRFTHWNDLRNIYGVDEAGFAPNTWDNVGVQYGLKSLQLGRISKDEFFWLNEVIGGWKQPQEIAGVSFPYDVENQVRGEPGRPNRTRGDLEAMRRAYLSGHVFLGHVDVPIIDTRYYLDPVLDMHHFLQSFAIRGRIERARGSADNHIIWVAHRESPIPLYWMAVQAMDRWLENMEDNPQDGVTGNRPVQATDACWDSNGGLLAQGEVVWDDGGACREAFPPYENSRTLAGMPVAGDVFKCQLMPVDEAVARGYYPADGPNAFRDEDMERLRAIFPEGVCDYSLPDAGLPAGFSW